MYNEEQLIPDWRTPEMRGIREGVNDGLLRVGEDERVVVVSADLAESVKIEKFAEKYPERFVEVGVAEQNMAGVAAGLSFVGKIPFMASYATFSPGRNWEQIRVSIALSKANVKIVGSHAGVSVGVNGPSHMGTEDIAIMRVLPEMVVLAPADSVECSAAVEAAYQYEGPVYIRTARPKSPVFLKQNKFEIGKIQVLREGSDVTIAACGIQVYQALLVAEELEKEGISCEVLNVSTIKPLDEQRIFMSVNKTKKIITLEDHQRDGGMGGVIAEFLGEHCPTQMKRVGIEDRFGVSGSYEDVYKVMGLDQLSITAKVRGFVVE